MILLDTTVFAYAAGDEHPLREPCRRVMRAHASGAVSAATTVEVIQEFAHVHQRRRSWATSVARARELMKALRLLSTQADDLDRGLEIYERCPTLGAFDAVLAAVALNHRVEALVSADRGFGSVPGLAWVDPGSNALEQLLGE